MMLSRIRRLSQLRNLWITIIAVLLIWGGWVWHQKTKPYHFLVVEEGVFYRSGTLTPENLIKVITTYKIRTVVNLRSPKENTESWYEKQKRILRGHKVEMLDIPMLYDTPPTKEQTATLLKLLDDPARLPALIHCRHGVVRTGMMVAVYQAEFQKRNNEVILKTLPMFGHALYIPGRKPMRNFILNYVPRWKANAQHQQARVESSPTRRN